MEASFSTALRLLNLPRAVSRYDRWLVGRSVSQSGLVRSAAWEFVITSQSTRNTPVRLWSLSLSLSLSVTRLGVCLLLSLCRLHVYNDNKRPWYCVERLVAKVWIRSTVKRADDVFIIMSQ
jgi:hypothetical protein